MKADRYLSFLLVVVVALLFFCARAQATKEHHGHYLVYVGTYGKKTKGIYVYRFDDSLETPVSLGLAAETVNPFWLATTANGRYLYAVNIGSHYNGQASGSVSAFAINPETGKLAAINQVSSGGSDPAYISLDKTRRFALIANYSGGSVAVLKVHTDGSLGEVTSLDQHAGSGASPKRQSAPHPHSVNVSPDNRYALSADLGLDKLFVYRFNSAAGSLSPAKPPYVSLTPGSGPRHFASSPNGRFVYVIGEMGSTVTVLSYAATDGMLHNLQVISTLPKDFVGDNTGAEVQVASSGRFLYASNRGDNTIAVFAINRHKGTLTPIEYVPTGGKTPGMFAIDPSGSYLFVANKDSDNVAIFRINRETGRLTPTGQPFYVPDPVFISFVPVD
jgi:6-phosphogluconolactonase